MAKNFLSPSQADRFFNCAGSVSAQEKIKYEPPPSPAAIEGTGIHAVAAHCLSNRIDVRTLEGQAFAFTYGGQNETIMINRDIVYAVSLYVNTIVKILLEAGVKLSALQVESKTQIKDLPIGGGKVYEGTCDVKFVAGSTLHIIDLKGGRGIIVNPFENRQCMSYAVESVEMMRMFITKVVIWIIQPRAKEGDFVKSWETTPERILTFKSELRTAIEKTQVKDPEFKQGSWCGFCVASGECPVLQKGIMQTVQKVIPKIDRVFPVVRTLTPEAIGNALPALKLLEAFIKNLEGYALTMLKQGKDVPNYVLVKTKPHRKWLDEGATIEFLSKYLDKDEFMEPAKLVTPATVEKLVDKAIIAPYVHKPEGDLKIALQKDADEYIKMTIDEVFKDVQFD